MEQINLIVPIVVSAILFLITQITKRVGWFKGKNPNIILYPVAIVAVFVVGYFYAPDMTIKQVVETGAMFAGGAGAFHLGKQAAGKLFLLVLDFMSGRKDG